MTQPILFADKMQAAGIRHGFTTRQGGVSQGAFTSFNLGDVGDNPQALLENQQRFEGYTGLPFSALVEIQQVHQTQVLWVGSDTSINPASGPRRFDASLTTRSDVVLAVRTADCVPILVACKQPECVAAVHAGWRGTLNQIIGNTIEQMVARLGCDPINLMAAIGPCIHKSHFEVGPEVYQPFAEAFGEEVVVRHQGVVFVDLVAANHKLLVGAGLHEDAIEVLPYCTCENEQMFFSYRRDQGHTGRQLSYISLMK